MSTPNAYTHPRDEILQTMERIYHYRMTTTSGGNLSIREENGDVWITPARLDKGGLQREDIVCVRANGTVEGERPPSSELPFHLALYRTRPDIFGIVHAHPVALVAFSMVREVPNTRLLPQARHVCGEAGFAPYELPGSEALGGSIASTFLQGYNCVILENHGVVTAGGSLQEAFHRFEALEFTGKTIIKACRLGDIRYLSDAEIDLHGRRSPRLPEFERKPLSSVEKELRRRLAEFVRRAYRQRLFISTQGSFSARVDHSNFVISPHELDRGGINPQDLVLVQNGEAEAGKLPSRTTRNHEAIYRQHPEIGAIVTAYPVNGTAFSVTSACLDTRAIPESYVLVRPIGRAPYSLEFEDPEALARQVSPQKPTAILENEGVLATGANILEAFDRLEVIESIAEALIDCRAIGTFAPMPESVTRELDRVFLNL